MSKEKFENIETEDLEIVDDHNVEEVAESKTSKVVGAIKKHGKKIAAGVAVAAVGLLAFTLGKKKGSNDDEVLIYDLESEDVDDIDSDVK